MLEWYRADEPYESLMADCAAILSECAKAAGTRAFVGRNAPRDPFAKPERLTVADAFSRFANIDLLATLPAGQPNLSAMIAAARAQNIRLANDDTWSDIFSRVLVEWIEPRLGLGTTTLLDEYPLPEAALARPAADPRVAQRFELYACGVELANGYGELTDPAEQRRRFDQSMTRKNASMACAIRRSGFHRRPRRHAAGGGIALGFDRLVMLATGATRIEQVLW